MSEKKQYIINYYLTLSSEEKINFVQQLIPKYWSELGIQISKTESESDFFMQYLFCDDSSEFLKNYKTQLDKKTKETLSTLNQLKTSLTLKILQAKEQEEHLKNEEQHINLFS